MADNITHNGSHPEKLTIALEKNLRDCREPTQLKHHVLGRTMEISILLVNISQGEELEREATAARATQGTIPQTQPDPSVRRPQGRPRGSTTRREENNQGNPTNAQEEQLRNARDVPMDRENPPSTSNARNQEHQRGAPKTSHSFANQGNEQIDVPESSCMNVDARQLRPRNQEILHNDGRNPRNKPGYGRPPRHPQNRGCVSNFFWRRRPMRDETHEASLSTGESRSYEHSWSTKTNRQTQDENISRHYFTDQESMSNLGSYQSESYSGTRSVSNYERRHREPDLCKQLDRRQPDLREHLNHNAPYLRNQLNQNANQQPVDRIQLRVIQLEDKFRKYQDGEYDKLLGYDSDEETEPFHPNILNSQFS
uniref:Uncharacterized protein n=1 Tax=Cannabis sativa TaxID=3483 RepID=A0A803NLT9_CANSA